MRSEIVWSSHIGLPGGLATRGRTRKLLQCIHMCHMYKMLCMMLCLCPGSPKARSTLGHNYTEYLPKELRVPNTRTGSNRHHGPCYAKLAKCCPQPPRRPRGLRISGLSRNVSREQRVRPSSVTRASSASRSSSRQQISARVPTGSIPRPPSPPVTGATHPQPPHAGAGARDGRGPHRKPARAHAPPRPQGAPTNPRAAARTPPRRFCVA